MAFAGYCSPEVLRESGRTERDGTKLPAATCSAAPEARVAHPLEVPGLEFLDVCAEGGWFSRPCEHPENIPWNI